MHKSKNIVHINTKAKRSQTSYLQEVWPFYSLTSVKDGIVSHFLVTSNVFLLAEKESSARCCLELSWGLSGMFYDTMCSTASASVMIMVCSAPCLT